MDWIVENWAIIAAVVGGLLLVTRIVVKLTTNKIDDAVLAAVEAAWGAVPKPASAEQPSASPALPGADAGGAPGLPMDAGEEEGAGPSSRDL